ncbi:CG31055 [Drosophila busckii]|uniref:CG31055 n=3 Tax=Drosophila busckii TaxID=30019 RepID=A0A0M4ET57_DROBS|nr:CG31055 [Drosophila busckii]
MSKSTNVVLQRRKLFVVSGNLSILVYYELYDGQLKVRNAKRLPSNKCGRGRRLRRYRRTLQHQALSTQHMAMRDAGNQTSANCGTMVSAADFLTSRADVSSQTARMEHSVRVDTQDLTMMISRYQQTSSREYQSECSQTKSCKLCTSATQMELVMAKCKFTQTKGCCSHASSTQTELLLTLENSATQTDEMEDRAVQELVVMSPYESLFKLMLNSIQGQSELLAGAVDSVRQLVELKQLGLKKQRLERLCAVDALARATIKSPPASEVCSELQRKRKLLLRRRTAQRGKQRGKHCRCRNLHRSRVRPSRLESATQTPNCCYSCQSTQTELELSCIATQTERDKAATQWWRRNSQSSQKK